MVFNRVHNRTSASSVHEDPDGSRSTSMPLIAIALHESDDAVVGLVGLSGGRDGDASVGGAAEAHDHRAASCLGGSHAGGEARSETVVVGELACARPAGLRESQDDVVHL